MGTWSQCVDEIAPSVEVCDGRDNNCNGSIDEGLSNCSLPCAPPCVATLAGSGQTGSTDGKGTNAQFFTPKALVVDSKGNIFVADTNNHLIRKITPDGTVTTFAGSGVQGSANGNGTNAEFRFPSGIAIDSQDNLYIADTENHTIRKINIQGTVSTIMGQANESGNVDGGLIRARLKLPQGIIVLSDNALYIADTGNHIIRKLDRKGALWNLQTIAGGGKFGWQDATNGLQALFDTPVGLATDGTALYVADSANHRIRRILLSTTNVSTVAGDGTKGFKDDKPLTGQLHSPSGIVFAQNKQFYIADTFNTRIRKLKLTLIKKDLSTVAGTFNQGHKDGPASQAQFDFPQGIAIGKQGQLYIADTDNHRIRVFYP
jgi:sugar lactone lactonase YvrE